MWPVGGAAGPALCWALPALGWLGGSALQLQQPALWPAPVLVGLALAALLAAVLGWPRRQRWAGSLLLALAAAALAFAATHQRAAWRLAQALPPALEGQDLVLTGVVASLPRFTPDGARFEFEVEGALQAGVPVTVPRRIALGWYRGPDEDTLLRGPPEEIRAGQRWTFTVRLRQPHGALNPHGFDLELWLFERGVRASGYVRVRPGQPALKRSENAGQTVHRLRQAVREAIGRQVDDPALAGVLAALAIGDQAAIEREDWDVFRATGVAHLMAISGLHVTMFAWLAAALIAALWRRHPRLPLWLPAPAAARWGGLACAAAYALLAGWGVPAQRTVWMLAAVALLRGSALHWPAPAVLLAAALLVVLLDPWALLQPGFWLSFVAVALLVVSEPVLSRADSPQGAWPRLRQAIRGGVHTQLVATVGLAPLTLLFFQQVSLVGLAANLLAIPLVTLLITPLALLGVLLAPLWTLAAALLQALMGVLQLLASWPLALWHAAVAPPWALVAGLFAGLLAVLPLPRWQRWLALPLLLPLLAPPVSRPPPGFFEMVVVDVGQGTAVLVRSTNHLLVYDAGPMYSREADAGSRVLLPLLRARGERRIHHLVLSHRDSDHVGGAAALLAALPVDQLSSSLADEHPLLAAVRHAQRCSAGQRWAWDGVVFEMLHPLDEDHGLPLKPNALSCVLRVQGANGSVLLTGDIEASQERALLARSRDALRSDVLLVPHHGSRTSSGVDFIAAVAPRVAVVQAAYRSRYGHPAPTVLARYEAQGVTVQRSDRCGAWTMPAKGAARCERVVSRRYWHHPGQVDPP